jgi:hypothetical protein
MNGYIIKLSFSEVPKERKRRSLLFYKLPGLKAGKKNENL